MGKYIIMFVLGIITSFYYFPAIPKAIPTVNTKMFVAVLGAALLLFNMARKNDTAINFKNYLILGVYALGVSMVGYVSIVINNTPDTAYATYFVSMFVWLIGAYGVTTLIKAYHKELTFSLLSNYIIGVCVVQCIITLMIDNIPSVKTFVDNLFISGIQFLEERNQRRLYGIGALLDTAGVRYSIALVLNAYLIIKTAKENENIKALFVYVICFLFVGFIGNMVARTTTVGVGLGGIYIIYKLLPRNGFFERYHKRIVNSLAICLVIGIPICIYFYNTDRNFKKQFEFGFEGFISLVETGKWEVGSNDQLKRMITWPENTKTWIIGDGYFNNPNTVDEYYTGKIYGGYYMGTDVGYLRFIYYFGITGLLAFSIFMLKASLLCSNVWPKQKAIWWIILLLNFIVWLKVASDIFVIFAYFLANEPLYRKQEDDEEPSLIEQRF